MLEGRRGSGGVADVLYTCCMYLEWVFGGDQTRKAGICANYRGEPLDWVQVSIYTVTCHDNNTYFMYIIYFNSLCLYKQVCFIMGWILKLIL